jgi:hypothetical protein
MKKIFLLALSTIAFFILSSAVAQAQVFHLAPHSEVRLPINAGESITIICDGVPQIKMFHTGFLQKMVGDHVTIEQIDLNTGRWTAISEHVCAMNSEPTMLTCPSPTGLVQPVSPANNVYYYTLSSCCGRSGVREIMLVAD